MNLAFVILFGCSLLAGVSNQSIRFYTNPRRYERLYTKPSSIPLHYSVHRSQIASNHILQNDMPDHYNHKFPGSLPSLRNRNIDIRRIPVVNSHHLPEFKYDTTNYASQKDNEMVPSYFRNGNHHHITIPVSRNSVTRITLPLVNRQPALTMRHHSPHATASWRHASSSRNFQNDVTPIVYPHPYHSTMIEPPTKTHHLVVHAGMKQHPSVQQHPATLPDLSYNTQINNNYYRPSRRNQPSVYNHNTAISTRTNANSRNLHSIRYQPQSSAFTPAQQIHHPLMATSIQQPRTADDWRNSLGTSTFQRKPKKNRRLKHFLNVKLKNPSRNTYHQTKRTDQNNNVSNMITTLVTPPAKLHDKKRTTVHIYLRHPQKHPVNSTVGTTKPPKSMHVPSSCVKCPSNQVLIIEKGKSCATVTIPPIKMCAWLSKKPGKLEMELGIGPKPGKSVKEGNYIMQFYLFKGGSKIQTCQFRINVKARRCSSLQSPENGIVQCTNNTLWGSTCNFSCDFGYKLVGEQTTTCDGDKTAVFWTTPPPVCQEVTLAFSRSGCKTPDNPDNGGVYCESEGDKDIYPVDSVCHFICNVGFTIPSHLTQYGFIICHGSEWNITKNIECHPTHCQPPTEPKNGFSNCKQAPPQGWTERGDTLSTNFLNGTTCHYKCNKDYVIPTSQLNITHIQCIAPFWNNTALPPECIIKTPPTHHPDDCHDVTLPVRERHTNISLTPRFFSADGSPLKVKCSLNETLITPGMYENYCEASDPELRTLSSCKYNITINAADCSALQDIPNGLIYCTPSEHNSFAVSSECHYECLNGYVIPTSMKNVSQRICLPSGNWNVTNTPMCKKRLVPQPQDNACHDVKIQINNLSSEYLEKPSFLTADGKAAEVTCTALNISHVGVFENTCQATDPELQTAASCKYKITVSGNDGHNTSSLKGCGSLKAPMNGKIQCQSKGSIKRCSIHCNEGYSLPPSFANLNRNFVECDSANGYHAAKFQNDGETDLPDCLAESPTTTLQVPLQFKVGVDSCFDYVALNNVMEAIQNSLQSRIKDYCGKVDCSDISQMCGEDDVRNASMLETTLKLKATYNATEHEDNEDISDAEANINELLEVVKNIVKSDTDFKEELGSVGGDLWEDSFDFERFNLACPSSGYVVDPDTSKCFQCPRGTFEEDGKCKSCPGNHYQDFTGRTYCMPCPHGTISKEGSRSKSDCQEIEQDLVFPEANREQALTESTVYTTCDSHPCKNGGTCNIMLNTFTCICKDGYTGKQCETVVCPENYCLNGGRCISFANNVVGCICPKLFSGPRCETYTEPKLCSSNPCENNGTCILEDDSYKCHCHSDYMGEYCQHKLCNKRFKHWYCLNRGICSMVSDSPVCLCLEEYTGIRCQHRKNG